MQVLLDHISAFLVATILFVSMFTVINRNRQNAVEMQIGQIVHEQAYEFSKIIERDLENIRSDAQVLAAGLTIDCSFSTDPNGQTLSLSIPTLDNPLAGAASGIVNIVYQLEAADTTLSILGEEHEIYTVNRYRRVGSADDAPLIPDGGSGAFITHFQVNMFSSAVATPVAPVAGKTTCPADGELNRSRIEFRAAMPTVDYGTDNKRSTNNLNVTRFGATVYSPNR